MNAGSVKVLLIDRDPERRKERISALKKNGYRVLPALDLEQAKQRCKPGTYDVIVANAEGWEHPELALEFCEWIKSTAPQQAVLLMIGAIVQLPRRDYMVSDIPERLVERIDSMFEAAEIVPKAA
jgi:DNA-binding response OmpR family regulator